MGDAGSHWSGEENRVTARAYVELLCAELQDQRLVKAELNRRVQQATGRSKGAVEFKFQNISAVLQDLTHPWVEGYKPATNYQDSLRDAVLDAVNTDVIRLAFESITRSDPDLDRLKTLSVVDPPSVLPKLNDPVTRRAVKVDFVRLDAENRERGAAGERLVLEHERSRLRTQGLPDLAERVEHVSQTQGDGLGFDVMSFRADGTERYLEVKTTSRGATWPMLISRNEVAFSSEVGEQFELVRVFDFAKQNPGCYSVPGDVNESCFLQPATFEALPRWHNDQN